jgi:hypothetical protein
MHGRATTGTSPTNGDTATNRSATGVRVQVVVGMERIIDPR